MGLNLLVTFANDIHDPHNLVHKIKSVFDGNLCKIIVYLCWEVREYRDHETSNNECI